MKAIITKYQPATNTRCAKICASAEAVKAVTITYPYGLDGEAAYRVAAEALCKKMNWSTDLIGGGIKNGWVFVFKDK